MEAVDIRFGPLAFDHADYDAGGDVLYRDGRLIVTVPVTVEASADELPPALQAA